jgi:hypothetical protein
MVAKIWPQKLVTDRRGSEQYVADMAATPYEFPVSSVPLRGSRAEVPGQQLILSYTWTFHPNPRNRDLTRLTDIGLWSRAWWNGSYYDIVAPPTFHNGTPQTRHWTMDVRERPETG